MFDNPSGEPRSLVTAGVRFLVFLMIALIIYFVVSIPVNMIFDSFQSTNFGAAETQKNTYMPIIRQCMTAFFAIFVSLPMTWFIFWCFHREPQYSQVDLSQWRR
jgi:uncharacterized BrkB/YihY/UPF0761 family membrane protein